MINRPVLNQYKKKFFEEHSYKLSDTEAALIMMLTENTGKHFLDSGGAYGWNWERNRCRNFINEPEAWLTIEGKNNFSVTKNIFHWLRGILEYNLKEDKKFHNWANKQDKYLGWIELIELYAEEMDYSFSDEWRGENTYNHESALSQVIQWYCLEREEGGAFIPLIFLQIHGGCDVRGGYTAPRVFWSKDDTYNIYTDAHCGIACTRCDARWYSDDSYHFYPQSNEIKFNDYEFVDLENNPDDEIIPEFVAEFVSEADERIYNGRKQLKLYKEVLPEFHEKQALLVAANEMKVMNEVLGILAQSEEKIIYKYRDEYVCPECHKGRLVGTP